MTESFPERVERIAYEQHITKEQALPIAFAERKFEIAMQNKKEKTDARS